MATERWHPRFFGRVITTMAFAVMFFGAVTWASALNTATFSVPSPAAGAAVLIKPSSPEVTADDSAMITGATVTMNGVPATFVTRQYFVGHGGYDEDAESYYWEIDDWTIARVMGYFPASAVIVGTNVIVTSVTSANGVSTHSRTFTLGPATTIGAVSPVAGAVLGSSPSSITVNWTSGSAPVSSSMRLDGVVVPTTYSVGTKTFTRTVASALSPGEHTVVFGARDAAGTTVSRTWSFRVSPPMSNGADCTVCHSSYPASHPVSGCEDCHDHGYPGPGGTHGDETPNVGCTTGWGCHRFDHAGGYDWGGSGPFQCADCHSATYPALPRHTAASTDEVHESTSTGCGPCHADSLVAEHAKYPTAVAIKYQCDLCHGSSARQQVKDAITGGETGCESCHSDAVHGDHASSVGTTPLGTTGTVCGDCHSVEISTEHVKPLSSSALTGCATCHPVQRSSFTTWNKSCSQGGCHMAGTATEMHGGIVDKHTVVAPSCAAVGCHAGGSDVSNIHVGQGCLTCHGAGKIPSTLCADCHDMDTPHGELTPAHQATLTFSVIHISGEDFGTHACSECHAANGLISIHGSADSDCVKCHPAPKDTLTPSWNKSCTQGECHTGSTATMHTAIDTDHAPGAENAACGASGCHATSSIASLHRDAVGLVDGVDRASCQICHAGGSPSASCLTCHPDRSEEHGYVADRHMGTPTAAPVTIGAVAYPALACTNCHDPELGPEHDKSSSTSSATDCATCHPTPFDTLTPWDKATCAQGDCHAGASSAVMHVDATADHATLPVNAACVASGCHGDTNLAAIHANASDSTYVPPRLSCMVCHSDGVPTVRDCTDAGCHVVAQPPHTDASTNSLHVSTTSGCGPCHSTALPAEHAKYPTGSVIKYACAECHGSTARQPVRDAIANGDTACSTCHGAAENVTAHAPLSGACTSCHSSYPASHPVSGCEDCHDRGYPGPVGAHGTETPTVAGCTGWGCHSFDHSGGDDWGASGPFTCTYCHSASFPGVPRHWVP